MTETNNTSNVPKGTKPIALDSTSTAKATGNAWLASETALQAVKDTEAVLRRIAKAYMPTARKAEGGFQILTPPVVSYVRALQEAQGPGFVMPTRPELRDHVYNLAGYFPAMPKELTPVERANFVATKRVSTFENHVTAAVQWAIMHVAGKTPLSYIGGNMTEPTPIESIDVDQVSGAGLCTPHHNIQPTEKLEGQTVPNENTTPARIAFGKTGAVWAAHGYTSKQSSDSQSGAGAENTFESAVAFVEKEIDGASQDQLESLETLVSHMPDSVFVNVLKEDLERFAGIVVAVSATVTSAQAKNPLIAVALSAAISELEQAADAGTSTAKIAA